MAEQYIICPYCNKEILLSQALTKQIEETLRKDFESELKSHEEDMENSFKVQLAAERCQAEKEAKESLSVELASLQQQISEKDEALKYARTQELELRKRQREIEEKERSLELEVARKIDDERQKIEELVVTRIADENRAKDIEKERQLSELRRQIEDLKRKAEQGSQQMQGESIELELEEVLRVNYPYDQIDPVGKGIKGADIVQLVHTKSGQPCGTIIWESKNTKLWNDGWIDKLKDDQRAYKAEIAVLATMTLPKGVSHFANVDGVWVTDFSTVLGVASALRENLLQVTGARLAVEGKSGKMEMIYSYLSGPEFKQRVEAIVESFVSMKEDLDREKRAMETSWSRREKQIQKVIGNVAGMYGDMQGIIGASLPKIESLEFPEYAKDRTSWNDNVTSKKVIENIEKMDEYVEEDLSNFEPHESPAHTNDKGNMIDGTTSNINLDIETQIINLAKKGRRMEAIKLYRKYANVGFGEAKKYIEDLGQ